MNAMLGVAIAALCISTLGVQLALLSHVVKMASWSGGISVTVTRLDKEVDSLRESRHEHANHLTIHHARLSAVEQRLPERRFERESEARS